MKPQQISKHAGICDSELYSDMQQVRPASVVSELTQTCEGRNTRGGPFELVLAYSCVPQHPALYHRCCGFGMSTLLTAHVLRKGYMLGPSSATANSR